MALVNMNLVRGVGDKEDYFKCYKCFDNVDNYNIKYDLHHGIHNECNDEVILQFDREF